jgi:hypothetical protein
MEVTMQSFKRYLVLLPAAVMLAACGRQERTAGTADEALSRDLALAATAQQYPQQFVSPQELGYGQPYQQYPQQYGYGAPQGYYPAPQPAVYRYPAPARRTTSTRSGTIYRAPAPAPQPTVVRNTKRDAMIGAATGAIAGAVIGRDVKGAVIGAAAGGLLGAVVGHTVDVQKRPY